MMRPLAMRPNMLATVVLALGLLLTAGAGAAQDTAGAQPDASGLTRLLTAEVARFSGKGGVYVRQLTGGEQASVNGEDHFDSASTIKLAIMATAFRLVDQHKLSLDDRHELKASDFRPGSGILKFHDPGLKLSLRDLITQMVITSDNTATDLVVGAVGGVAAVNAFLKQDGYRAIHLNMTDYEYFRRPYELIDPKYKDLSPEDVFALSSNIPAIIAPRRELIERVRRESAEHHVTEQTAKLATVEEKWHGVVSPAEVGRLLEGIERNTIASPASCAEMRRILLEQQAGTRKIPQFLAVPVGHKTGEVGGVTNDAGIIYAHSGPIVIALYTMGYAGNAGDADDRLARVARLVVDYFDGAANGRRGN